MAVTARGDAQEPHALLPIDSVLARHSAEWMSVPGVVGTGIGLCDASPCIKVFVEKRTAEIERRIPAGAEGHPVSIEVVGLIRRRD